jgi:hypothetical protein
LIFSLLKIRKRTSAVIAGILIAMACLWGIAMWQDISPAQLFNLFLASLVFILGIMLLALLVIVAAKLLIKLVKGADRET